MRVKPEYWSCVEVRVQVGLDVEVVERRREVTEKLKRRALELGFDAVGVTTAEPPDPRDALRAWIERGDHAGLEYMKESLETRADLQKLMPGARSVVVVAISYWDGSERNEGRIAKYARADDYHGFLKKRIRKLRKALLELEPEARVHPALDTSPLLERALAARAGIAWIGKSTMAISRRLGTYTFLAALVTDADLEPDSPHDDFCGSCTQCLDACPTQAFRGPYELDARKCIAYWTVEHFGELPPSAPPPHGWVFGCDICQVVCPWNKFAQVTRERRLTPREELVKLDLDRIARPEEKEYRETLIRGTPLERSGERGIQRNAEWVRSFELKESRPSPHTDPISS